jgi:hypothetical protein
MFTLQTSFNSLLLRGQGGKILKCEVDVTVNSKDENSEDFCPNYVHEFGLCCPIEQLLALLPL